MLDARAQASAEARDAVRRIAVAMDHYSVAVGVISGAHRTHLGALSVIIDATVRGEDVTAGRLGAALGLRSAATTALVDRLEQTGHVVRTRDAADRRQVLVRITDEALELGRQLYSPLDRAIGAELDGFSADELRVARRVLDAMTAGATDAAERLRTGDAAERPPTH